MNGEKVKSQCSGIDRPDDGFLCDGRDRGGGRFAESFADTLLSNDSGCNVASQSEIENLEALNQA